MTTVPDAHAELARRDRALPGLAVLFDPARLAGALEVRTGAPVSSVEPIYLRYKRGTSCLVGYRVSGAMGPSYVYAKAYRRSAHAKLHKAVRRDDLVTWLGAGPLVLPEAAVTVWAHPSDARLRMLRHLEGGAGDVLRRAPRSLREHPVAFRTMSYKPERRFVTEVRRTDKPSRGAVLKLYTAAGFEEAAVRTAGVTARDVLRVPAQLRRDARRHLLFLEWLDGRLAADLVFSGEPLSGRIALAGEALAELHAQPLRSELPPSASYDPRAALRVIDEVECLLPPLATPLARLRTSLAGASAPLLAGLAPVHGDFHFRQILLSPPTVGFVDFDRAGAGPAVGDLACAAAHLERDVLAGAVTRERADAVMEELLAGYGRRRRVPLSRTIDVYTAAALAALLPEPFRHFRPDAADLTARMADRAVMLLANPSTRTAAS